MGVLSGAIWAYGMGLECGWGVGLVSGFWFWLGYLVGVWETSGIALGREFGLGDFWLLGLGLDGD